MNESLFTRLLTIATHLAAASDGRVTLVKHEDDETSFPQPEAQEFLKLDLRVHRRDRRPGVCRR